MKKPSSRGSIHSRFVPSEEIDAVAQWQFSAVTSAALGGQNGAAAKAENDFPERAIVHVHYTAPHDAIDVNIERVALREMVIEKRGK